MLFTTLKLVSINVQKTEKGEGERLRRAGVSHSVRFHKVNRVHQVDPHGINRKQ